MSDGWLPSVFHTSESYTEGDTASRIPDFSLLVGPGPSPNFPWRCKHGEFEPQSLLVAIMSIDPEAMHIGVRNCER